MSDGRANRKSKVVAFFDQLDHDRTANLKSLIDVARLLNMEGFGAIKWRQAAWKVTSGNLIHLTGKNTLSSTFNFTFPPKLGGQNLEGQWADVCKALMLLRFHRKNQTAPNQRNFITAVGYVARAAINLGLNLSKLTPEALDDACRLMSKHYSDGTAYNLQKAVGEFAGHCDANGLCRIVFKYKYTGMVRPENTGGVGQMRLDDPQVAETKNDKLVAPEVFKIIGELYQNVPTEHKYRTYVLILTLLCCLGRRFSEISLLPFQQLKVDIDGQEYLEYFPRKISKGDVFTPIRKLYMSTEVLPIVRSVLAELEITCRPARETAAEMLLKQNADLRFLSNIVDDQRLYKKDLVRLGIPASILFQSGWIRQNGHAFVDLDRLNKKGHERRKPDLYTYKKWIVAYCERHYSKIFVDPIHIDQQGKKYYLNDLLLVRYMGLSTGAYSCWVATQCTHSMMTTFLCYFPDLAKKYASLSIKVDFTSHHFRHTLNTLLDEGGLSDLLQTEWFGRSNPNDTKAYQHTSRAKRALMLRDDLKAGRAGGIIAEQLKVMPTTVRDAFLHAKIRAVHDVGTGLCVHDFSQIPCERHLQCSAQCYDYVWVKNDPGRLDELKRQYSMTFIARKTAEEKSRTGKPKKSSDWLAHNDKKLKVLSQQLLDNGVEGFDPEKYLEDKTND